jgi:hypothetical protein
MRLPVLLAAILVALLAGCARRQAAAPTPAPTADSRTPYTRPLASLGTKFGWLPQAAQNTVLAEAGSEEIHDVVKSAGTDRVYYKVTFKDAAHFPPLYVTPDGSVLNPDLTVAVPATKDSTGGLPSEVVTTNDLPANVQRVLQERAVNAPLEVIHKETWGNHLVYIFSFKEEAHQPKLYVVADGTVLIPAVAK